MISYLIRNRGQKIALALSYCTAEYATPVWARSLHAKNLDPELNRACRSVTGCLKPTNVEDLYFLWGIVSPAIRRDASARVEKHKPTYHLKLLDTANGGIDCAINHTQASLTFTKRWQKVITVHGPHGNVSTICAQGILAAKHKGRSGSSTHVCVEEQIKTRHTYYSTPNSHIPTLYSLLCSVMLENNARNYGKRLFDDTTMPMMRLQCWIGFA